MHLVIIEYQNHTKNVVSHLVLKMSSIRNEQKGEVLETKNKELPSVESQRKGVFQSFNKPVKCQLIEADDE